MTKNPKSKKLAPAKIDRRATLAQSTVDQGTFLTTNQGLKIQDDHNSLKAGIRGPSLLEDFQLREKITHFDHERIPERVVHARGAAAHGFFEPYDNASKHCKAHFLSDPANRTPVFVRFSTVAGSRGSADLARDVRGFAVKFYTDEGNFDLVGNNIPVFFIQDAQKFPDLVHSVKPEPHNEIPQAASAHDTFWDFVSLMPESMHMVMWAMSDRAIPRSYRMMEGFGVHTFRLIDAKNKSVFVKFHWKPKISMQSITWDEALKINGYDPDFHRRDLFEAIDTGHFPEWELGFQTFTEAQGEKFDFDYLDPTKLIPEEQIPVVKVGRMVLNRNPDNYFAETEQVAFHPGHIVPGIDFSNDPLLAGRLFSYTDTQLSRLGSPNFHELPINKPVCPMSNHQRDAHMRQTINPGRVAYEPNSLASGCPMQVARKDGGFVSFPESIQGEKMRGRGPKFFDHFSQARQFYISQTEVEQKHIQNALKFELGKVETVTIRQRLLGLLLRIDRDLASKVGEGLGLVPKPIPDNDVNHGRPAGAGSEYNSLPTRLDVKPSDALSILKVQNDSIETQKVAVLVTEGFDQIHVDALEAALKKEKAEIKLVGPRVGTIRNSEKKEVALDFSFQTSASVLFDAVFIPGGKGLATKLAKEANALRFIAECYKHCKTLGLAEDSVELLKHSGLDRVLPERDEAEFRDLGVIISDKNVASKFVSAMKGARYWIRESMPLPPV